MAQILVEGGCPEANLSRAVSMIREAACQGCDVAVLPECLDLGWTHPSARTQAQPVPGPRSDVLAAAAAENRIHVVAGLTEREGSHIYNSAVLLSPKGDLLLKHRKINELDIAGDLYSTGDRLGVVETPLGILGMTICADNFPDSLELASSLGRMGCRFLLSPCAWAVDATHDNAADPYGSLWLEAYATLAERFDMTIAGVSNVGWLTAGPWAGRKCIGCSLAVGPGGLVLARAPYGESAEVLCAVSVPSAPPR